MIIAIRNKSSVPRPAHRRRWPFQAYAQIRPLVWVG